MSTFHSLQKLNNNRREVNSLEDLIKRIPNRKWQIINIILYSLALLSVGGSFTFNDLGLGALKYKCLFPNSSNYSVKISPNQCEVKLYRNVSGSSVTSYISTESCKSFYYSPGEIFETSAISRFNAVCENKFLIKLDLFIYLLGGILASMSLSPMADVFGRKKVVSGMLLLGAIAELGMTVAIPYVFFALCRLSEGYFTSGIYQICFTTTLEFSPRTSRDSIAVLIYLFFAFSLIINAFTSWLLRKWIPFLFVSIVMYCIPLLCILIFGVESPRWLYVKKPYEFSKFIQKQFKSNPELFSTDIQFFLKENCTTTKVKAKQLDNTDTLLSVLRNKKIMFNMFFLVSFAISTYLVYYGILFGASVFELNPHIYYAFLGIAEIFGSILMFVLSRFLSRRPIHFISFFFSGLLCAIAGIIPKSNILCISFIYFSVVMGKLFSTVSFANHFVWASELYPTSHRSLLTGVTISSGRIAVLSIPYIKFLAEEIWQPLLPLCFGGSAVIISFLCIFVQDSKKLELMDKIVQSPVELDDVGDTNI